MEGTSTKVSQGGGFFKCPNCHQQFETNTELQQHFAENPNCSDYAQQLMANIKYDFRPLFEEVL